MKLRNNLNQFKTNIKESGNIERYTTIFGLVGIFIVSSIISPVFLKPANLMNILRQIPINGFMALGMTIVILSGGIDLSVGGVLSLSSVATALLLMQFGVIPTVIMIIIIGASMGFINGFILSRWDLEPFVVTLGVQTIASGLAFYWSNGRTVIIDNVPDSINALSNANIGPIPLSIILMSVAYIFMWFILKKTVFGRYIYAIGGNEEVCYLSGVNLKLVRLLIFVISGVTAAIAGIFHVSRISVGDPASGATVTMFVIASVIVGGTKFNGGRGGVGLTIIGLLVIGILNNILNLIGVSYYFQMVIQGIIIISAVLVTSSRRKEA